MYICIVKPLIIREINYEYNLEKYLRKQKRGFNRWILNSIGNLSIEIMNNNLLNIVFYTDGLLIL